jgi:histone H3/H4
MSEFSKSLLKIIVAQIAKDSGFDGISTRACSVLIDIAERYLLLLAQLTLENAKHRDCIQVNLPDVLLAFDELLVTVKSLGNYWGKWGIRIPTNKLQQHKERGAATAGSGNAIIEAILGFRKPIIEEEKPVLPKEVSGFFRMEPGPFPLGISLSLNSD